MIRRAVLSLIAVGVLSLTVSDAEAQQRWGKQQVRPVSHQTAYGQAYNQVPNSHRAYGRVWGGLHSNHNWNRFYHYPYVYYPHNYWGQEYFRSADHLYYRYPQEMRIPVYNRQWHNYYPNERPWHWGHHFILDVF